LSFRGQLSDCVECWIIHDAPPFSVMDLPEDFRRAHLASLGRGLSPYIRQKASASPCKHGKQRFLRMHGSMLTRKKMLVLAD